MSRTQAHKLRRWCALTLLLLGGGMLWGQRNNAQQPSLPFVPTHAPANANYIGAQACAACHAQHAASYRHSGMARALEPCATCEVLQNHPTLTAQRGRFTYRITRDGEQSLYTVSDGKDTITEPIVWCFGKGVAGQTYLLKHNGQWYESRVSFYQAINGLDTTIGAPKTAPTTMLEAFGRALQAVETKDCFSCHATAAVRNNQLQLDQMTPGITCEACHGPGAEHIALMKSNPQSAIQTPQSKAIFNPAQLAPYDLSQQFCGACHRSWEQVQLMELRGVENVRFQPYRLAESRCYDAEDRRISCTACHNPHEETRTGKTAYDANCLACHQKRDSQTVTSTRIPVCPKSQTSCASCHMPKYEIPNSHFKFTDHLIRVVKPGESYPH
jgi:Cytochrome c554 and c-prime